MTKRILNRIRLDKIAAVDLPCQEHATVAIIKRRPAGPEAIIKATFQQALTGCLVADQVREAFYTAFDNMYDGQQAFRTALVDELQAGGDGTVASAAYKSWLGSLVDQALGAAKQAGAATITDDDLNKAFTATATEWLKSKQEERPVFKFKTKADLQAAIAKFSPNTSTFQDVMDIQDSAEQLNEIGLLPVALAKSAPSSAETADLKKQVAVLSLSPDLRKHYDALSADKQTAFLAKDAAGQQAEYAAANVEDPVVYTMTDGTEVRKSAGAAMIAMAKSNDSMAKQIANLTNGAGEAAIEKALLAYPHVNKGVATTMLKSVANGTAEEKASVTAALVAMDKANSGVFKRVGSGAGGAIDIEKGLDTPAGQMGAIIKRIAKDKGISEAKATVEALNDPEYQAAYAKSLEDVPAVASAG